LQRHERSDGHPQPDGDFIQNSTLQQLHDGDFVKVPLLNGANTDEGTAFLPYAFNSDKNFTDYVLSQGPDLETAETLLKLYPDIPAIGIPDTLYGRPNETIGTQYKRAAAYNGDYYFIAGRRFASQMWSKHNVPTYSYRFNTAHYDGQEDFTSVTHAVEQPFVFDITDSTYDAFTDMPPSYFELANLMSKMWVSFVVDGTPNGHGVEGVPEWPVYEAEGGYGENFVFDANVTSYVEPDTFRAEAIAYLQGQWLTQYNYDEGVAY
jgi:triacylglycerol lipase